MQAKSQELWKEVICGLMNYKLKKKKRKNKIND